MKKIILVVGIFTVYHLGVMEAAAEGNNESSFFNRIKHIFSSGASVNPSTKTPTIVIPHTRKERLELLIEMIIDNKRQEAQSILYSCSDGCLIDLILPLHIAIAKKRLSMVQLLLRHNATAHLPNFNPNTHLPSNSENWTPLHRAVFNGSVDIAHELLKKIATTKVHYQVPSDLIEFSIASFLEARDETKADKNGNIFKFYQIIFKL